MGKIICRLFFQAVCVLWKLRREEKKRNETSLYIYIHTHTRVLVVAGGPVLKQISDAKKEPSEKDEFLE